MTQLCRRCLALGVLLLFAVVGVASAQTTGSIVGRVTDEQGGVLPGVTVEARSPALQGARTAVTDETGTYRLTLLPPGIYTVSFTLEGFAAESRKDVTVALAKDTALNPSLRTAVAEEITVTAEVPVVNTTTTELGTSLDSRSLETLPTGRNYSSVVQITPGVSSDANAENTGQSSITVYGSTGAENVFYVDGVNTTGVEYGFQGKELNFEFIEAVDVKTGGYEAELGRATGGVINVITKSGGNEFHGDVFGYYDSDSLQSSADQVVATSGTVNGYTRDDYGIDLGGYVLRDKLWFFAAYDRVKNSQDNELDLDPLPTLTVTSDSDHDLGAAKLTYRLSESQSLIGTFFQDPRDDTGAINDAQHSLNGEPDTYEGIRSFGGKDYALRYEGVLASQWVLTLQGARHQEENSVGPATADGDRIQFRVASADFFQNGGFGLIQEKTFDRDFWGGSLTRFLGGHQVKFGAEYEKESADVVRRYSGGQQIDIFTPPPGFPAVIFSHFYWTTPDATLDNAPVSALVASPEHKITTAYLQDRWSARPNLTVNLGVRWDRQEIIDASGEKRVDLKNDYAPRLGFVWDPEAQGHSKLFGSFGRYYEQIPMDLVIRSFSFERQARIFNTSAASTHPDPAAEAALGRSSAIFGGFTEPVDPDLENQYLNEYILGYEREVLPDVAVGIKGIYREYGQVIEDFLCADDGTYCIGNPGEGLMKRVFTLDYSQTFPAPKPERKFKGVQLDVQKRLSKNWQGLASYIYSKLDGNFDGLYSPFTNVGADPNITAAYDYYDFFTNGADLTRITNTGPLSNDRRHQFKLSGTWFSPWKLSVGASAYYRTGTPITRYGYSDIYGRYEFFLTKRGAEGRTPDNYEADLHLGYPLTVGPVTVNFLADVFNLLNAQKAILVDERWGFEEADNASPTPVNPGYKKPVLRTPPTSFRLGVRVSF
ncbi:MAG TPA: TonB-dependent receptor [Thermoanaerobaculia bacterium]|nr:TonB-dependent receptor [Thermoanaerobaculia bacterium]